MARPPRGLPGSALSRIRQDLNNPVGGSLPPESTLPDTARVRTYQNLVEDLDPYFVAEASEYYKGPDLSTRVKAHQFIPIGIDKEELLSDQFMPQLVRGYVYVRFHKYDTLWRYGPMSLSDYRSFKNSGSKGQYVRQMEVYGHGRAPDYPPELGI
jgi:hypothetical protein